MEIDIWTDIAIMPAAYCYDQDCLECCLDLGEHILSHCKTSSAKNYTKYYNLYIMCCFGYDFKIKKEIKSLFHIRSVLKMFLVSTYNSQLGSFDPKFSVHLLNHRQGFSINQIQRPSSQYIYDHYPSNVGAKFNSTWSTRFTCDSDVSHVGCKFTTY